MQKTARATTTTTMGSLVTMLMAYTEVTITFPLPVVRIYFHSDALPCLPLTFAPLPILFFLNITVNDTLSLDLRHSFETVFEFVTQLLSRCTWAGDRNGQCIALSCWSVRIKPEDHVFVNKTGIFRVLQTVLDDARNSMALISSESSSRPGQGNGGTSLSGGGGGMGSSGGSLGIGNPQVHHGGLFSMSLQEHRQGPYGAELMQQTLRRLSKLVLCVVHSLASQVAHCSDASDNASSPWTTSPSSPSIRNVMSSSPTNTTATINVVSSTLPGPPRLQRMPSGPDTLSQSLFDMLYAELFAGLKGVIQQSMDAARRCSMEHAQTSTATSSTTTNTDSKNPVSDRNISAGVTPSSLPPPPSTSSTTTRNTPISLPPHPATSTSGSGAARGTFLSSMAGFHTPAISMAGMRALEPSSSSNSHNNTHGSTHSNHPPSQSGSLSDHSHNSLQTDLLEGEQYTYRILRLLYFVSNSKICQRSLTTPKWLSLLLSSFSCGEYLTQRRMLRLIRRLLMNLDPKQFRAFVPHLYSDREEMTLSEGDSPTFSYLAYINPLTHHDYLINPGFNF